MQLIKDFSDIQKFVSFLGFDYQQRLLADINSLLVKYMAEQSKNNSPAPPQTTIQAPTQMPNYANSPPPAFTAPPPPPAFTGSPQSPQISKPSFPQMPLGGININRSTSQGLSNMLTPTKSNKKPQISFNEAISYIVPFLTEMGTDASKSQNLSMDLFRLFKQIDGVSSIKEIYLSEYQNIKLGVFLEKIQDNYKERNINLKKKAGLPQDFELQMKIGDVLIALGFINDTDLQKALNAQKNPTTDQNTSNAPSWMNKSMLSGDSENKGPVRKKLLGDTIVELGIINKEQLNFCLSIQRLFKNIVESR